MTTNIASHEPLVATPLAPTPRVSRLAEDALLFQFTAAGESRPTLPLQQRLWALVEALESRRAELGLLEIVPGMGNLLLRVASTDNLSTQTRIDTLTDHVLTCWNSVSPTDSPGRTITIPVTYGGEAGPDLQTVAAHTGLSGDAIIARHSAGLYRVFCLGFQPGFAYLGGLDPALAIPRRATPRLSIPAGSVAIGGNQTAVYPSASPGGWHIIGRTALMLFDPSREQPALLIAGDTVRFVAARSAP
ncbi:MAG: 5-oxoprolinase subunit PxpB [Pseudomonadota bacterium]